MPKVICGLPNASELINGVKFVVHELGMLSEEVADDVAAAFAKIPGYFVHAEQAPAPPAPEGATQPPAEVPPVEPPPAAADQAPVEAEKPTGEAAPVADTQAPAPPKAGKKK